MIISGIKSGMVDEVPTVVHPRLAILTENPYSPHLIPTRGQNLPARECLLRSSARKLDFVFAMEDVIFTSCTSNGEQPTCIFCASKWYPREPSRNIRSTLVK